MKMRSLVLTCLFLCGALADNVEFHQPNSYSQVRFTSTRRNGTFDPSNNLANHRMQVTPKYQLMTPQSVTKTPPPPSFVQQPASVEVQNAVRDSIMQNAAAATPSSAAMAAYLANFYPQFSEVLQNKGHMQQTPHDLQHLPSYAQTVVVQPPPQVPEFEGSSNSDQSEVSHSQEQAHEYQEEPWNITSEMHSSSHDSHYSDAHYGQTAPANSHYYPDGTSDNRYHGEDLAAHDYEVKRPAHNDGYNNEQHAHYELGTQHVQPNINLKGQHPEDANANRRFDSNLQQPTTTDCPACRLFHEEMLKRQEQLQMVKTPPSFENTLPHTDDMKEMMVSMPVPSNVRVPESFQPQPSATEGKNPNFTAPSVNEIFSITDAVIPQMSPPDLNNFSQFVTQRNAFQPVGSIPPTSQLVLNQGVPPGMAPQFLQNPNLQIQNPNGQPRPNVLLISASHPRPNQQLPMMGNILRMPAKPSVNGQAGGLFLQPNPFPVNNDLKDKPTVNHILRTSPNRNSPNFMSMLPNQASPSVGFNPAQFHTQNANGVGSQSGIAGPMGIPIPIPPKSVPAHSVLSPPNTLPAPYGGMAPPFQKKNPGIFDSLMSFFSGGKLQNRGRSLENGDIVLSSEDMLNDTLLLNMSDIAALLADEMGAEEENATSVASNGTARTKRAIIDKLPDYLETLYRQFSDDFRRFTSPLLPMLRDTFRHSFASQDVNSDEHTSENKTQKPSLWSSLLDSYTESHSTKDPATDELSDKNDDNRVYRLQQIHSFFTGMRKNNKSTSFGYRPACANKTDATFCLQDEYYPKSLIYGHLLRYKLFGSTHECDSTLDNTSADKIKSVSKLTCESPSQEIHPLRAKNTRGEWKIIVNIPSLCQQTVNLKKCHPSCIFCSEKEVTYQMLVYETQKGLHHDSFKFMSGCSCPL